MIFARSTYVHTYAPSICIDLHVDTTHLTHLAELGTHQPLLPVCVRVCFLFLLLGVVLGSFLAFVRCS